MRCPECHVKMTQSQLVNRVFLVHEPGVGEIMRALRCPLFGASTIPEIPATSGAPQKGLSKDEVLLRVRLRAWAREDGWSELW